MPSTADYLALQMEETPRYEGAPTTTPYRISSVVRYFPLTSARIGINPTPLDRSDELRSIEGGVPQLKNGYEPDAALAERANPNDLPFLFTLAGFTGTYTAGAASGVTDPDGGVIPVGAHRWVFNKRGGLTAKTAQLIFAYFSSGVYLKGQGFGISTLGLNSAGEVTTDWTGLVVGNVADPNLTATYDASAIPPFRRGDLTLTWLTGSGVTDDFSLSIANPLTRVRSMSITPASYFPDKLEHGDDRVRVTGTIPKRTLDSDDINAVLEATSFSATAKWVSPKVIGATTYKYSMWIQMPACQIIGGGADDLGNRRRYGGSYDWWAAWDETLGYDCRITIVNAVTAVETLV